MTRKILSLILAVMMAAFISVPSFAEETNDTDWIPESTDNDDFFDDDEFEDDDDLVTFDDDDDLVTFDDDDWGYADPELIAAHTPEMTEEFIHADDPDWKPEDGDEDTPEKQETPSETPEDTETKTEEPGADDGKENGENPDEENGNPAEDGIPDEKPEDVDEPRGAEVTVTIVTTMTGENEMKLSAVVNDPEGRDYTFQWQVSEDGGETYTDIADATTAEMEIELTEENIKDMWRVKVQAI